MQLSASETQDETVMVSLNGAPGDHLHALPALRQFCKKFATLVMTAHWRGGLVKAVYENTGIVDHFVWLDQDKMEGWSEAQISEYLLQQLAEHDFEYHVPLRGIHSMMSSPEEWDKIPIDAMREWQDRHSVYDRYCNVLGVPEVKGARPEMVFTDEELDWARKFRDQFDARIVGWQWSGSSGVKQFPELRTFDLLSTLVTEYPDIHIFTMGSQRFSDTRIPESNCTNLAGKISWREACLLISLMDLYIAPDTSVMVAAQGFPDVPKILLATTTSGSQIAFPETKIIQSTAACSPCYRVIDKCDVGDCCGMIDELVIYGAVDNILRS